MFGKHLRLKRFLGGIAVTAAVAVVAAPSAFSMTSSKGGSAKGTQAQGYRFITDTLGGARHVVQAQQVQGTGPYIGTLPSGYTLGGTRQLTQQQAVEHNRFTSDGFDSSWNGRQVHGYNTSAYVPGSASPAVAKAIQSIGYGRATAPLVTGGSSGTGFNWGAVSMGVGLAGLLLLLVLGGMWLRTDKSRVSTA